MSSVPILLPISSIFYFNIENINITRISCGAHYTLCITIEGQMFGWGLNEEGQVGIGKDTKLVSKPTLIDIYDVIDVSCGEAHSLALCISSGESKVYSWGRGKHGQLGQGVTKSLSKPTMLLSLAGMDIFSINCGSNHSCILVDDGLLYIWGYGGKGQIGRGSTHSVNIPKIIPALKDIKIRSVKCGGNHTIALGDIDNVYGWGDNSYHQIDDSDKSFYIEPVLISKLSNKEIVSIEVGSKHSIFLSQNGIIYYNGDNIGYNEGNMYIPANKGSNLPHEINGNGVFKIFSGYDHIALGSTINMVPSKYLKNDDIPYSITGHILTFATKPIKKPKPPKPNKPTRIVYYNIFNRNQDQKVHIQQQLQVKKILI